MRNDRRAIQQSKCSPLECLGKAALLLALAIPVVAQEVIMNVPSADVVSAGHVFVRADSFYTQSPAYFEENANVAVGVGHGLELSLNGADLSHESRVVVPGFKWALKRGTFTGFVGDQVTLPVRGIVGNNSYEALAWTRGNWRLTGGSFQSHNAVQFGNRAGVLAGVEWTAKTFRSGWALVPGIDWASGSGSNGYTSPGLMFMRKNFFFCPGYMIGNPGNKYGAHEAFVMIGTTI